MGSRVEVRGIYATALTRLLLDRGFQVVNLSEEASERFGLETSEAEPEILVRDRRDRQGVRVRGDAGGVESVRAALFEELEESIFRRPWGCLDVEFTWGSKLRLDGLRGAVYPTLTGHHFYKACGGEVSAAVDMAERLVLRGEPKEDVERGFRRTVEPYFPWEESEVEVEHVKLNGVELCLGRAEIDIYEEPKIRYRRGIMGGGFYDGVGVEKEAGDTALTEAVLGEYHTRTSYYSGEGRLKGAYTNINTPLEVYPTKVRYVDLEVDLCYWPDGSLAVIDEDRLEEAALRGTITGRLRDRAKVEVKRLLEVQGSSPGP